MKEQVTTIEFPDTRGVINFLGEHGCTIKATLEKNSKTKKFGIYVIVLADDDRNTVLGEILAEVPKSDKE